MSSHPDAHPEIGETLSEVVRKPTRTAGDLSEAAEGAAGLTTEDIARDLESAASISRTSDSELLEELLDRVERYRSEISELRERVHEIERKIASLPEPGEVDSSGV